MILSILVLSNSSVLVCLSLLHFYWAAGGKWGIEYTIPDKFKSSYFNTQNKTYITIATLCIALGFLFAALIVSSNYLNLESIIPHSWSIWGDRIIGITFILRAIGDFQTCGIFKKKSDSKFTQSDTKLFIPLCLFIGFSSVLITFLE